MTDRYVGFVVVLEQDLREDDAQSVLSALRHIKGVVSVEPALADVNQLSGAMREQARILKLIGEMIDKITLQGRLP